MAGFAINLQLLHERPAAKLAYKESLLLTSLGVRQSDLEALGPTIAAEFLSGHTRTAPPKLIMLPCWLKRGLTLPPVIAPLA
uniref:DNA-directed DNA polymerase n=1 Tax=Macrostomum lignano TaxID=282301 RepID=A0A1I8FDF4_9PLAT